MKKLVLLLLGVIAVVVVLIKSSSTPTDNAEEPAAPQKTDLAGPARPSVVPTPTLPQPAPPEITPQPLKPYEPSTASVTPPAETPRPAEPTVPVVVDDQPKESFEPVLAPHDTWTAKIAYNDVHLATKETRVVSGVSGQGRDVKYLAPVKTTKFRFVTEKAEFVSWSGSDVTLKAANGLTRTFRPGALADADKKWLNRWKMIHDKTHWTDRSGHEVEATLVGTNANKIQLKKSGGSTIEVNISALSDADQKFVAMVKGNS